MSGHRLNSAAPDPAARRARWGVAGLFASNGLGYPSVVPWLPEIKNQLELSNTALGTAIAAMPLGALLTGCQRVAMRLGSALSLRYFSHVDEVPRATVGI